MESGDSSLGLDPDGLKSLESTRKQLLQLINSLQSQANAISFGAASSPHSIQAHYVILQKNLESLTRIFRENYGLFQCMAVHPSTNFPGREPQNVGFLEVLLRRRLEPMVEEWVDDSREAAEAAGIDPAKLALSPKRGLDGDNYGESDGDDEPLEVPSDPLNERWADIRQSCEDAITEYITVESEKPYTKEEYEMGIENVRTGLRRSLDEDEDEDEDEDDDEKEDGKEGGDEDDEEDDEDEDVEMGSATATGRVIDRVMEPGEPAEKRLYPEHWVWAMSQGDLDLPGSIKIQYTRG